MRARPPPAPCCPPPPPLLLVLVALALAPVLGGRAAPPCSPAPPGVGWVRELARRAAVVIEGKVVPAEEGAEAGRRRLLLLLQGRRAPEQPPGPGPGAARVRVRQVWAGKGGGLRKDALIWVLGAAGPACGRLKEGSRYIFFMEPVADNGTATLFAASAAPLETGGSLRKEVGRALCRGCGRATSEGPSQHSLAPTETNSSSSYNNQWDPNRDMNPEKQQGTPQPTVLVRDTSQKTR